MSLLTSRRLAPLLVTQTLGALNDNLFKNALVVLILLRVGEAGAGALVAVAGGVFILPYLLFSATAGQVADRFEKSRTILVVKLWEVALMALAAAGFWYGSIGLLFAVLFGLGVQATFFSPLKYAILPAALAEVELVAGNGLIEAGTFLGILAGTIAGSALFALQDGPLLVSVAGLAVAAAGVAAALLIPRAAAATPGLRIGPNLVRETARLLGTARANRPVWLSLLGLSWFWAVGATVLAELPTVVKHDLQAAPPVFTLMLAVFSLGIGAGSVLCSRLLRGEVSPRLVPFAALGLSVFLGDFGWTVSTAPALPTVAAVLHSVAGWHMLADLLLLAACGGLYSVPLYAMMQEHAAPAAQARMIAANNVVNAAAIVVGAVLTAGLALLGVAPWAVLVLAAAANLAVACWIVRILPQTTLRALFRWYFVTFHGVTIRGLDRLPPDGRRRVYVVNHQSFLDGCFVAAFLPGSPTFAVNVHTAGKWWARPLLAAVRTFRVDPANPYSTKTMVRAVKDGAALVVFPEGRLTTTGALMKVYEGAGMVADKAGAAIVPIRIDGLQDTRLSRLAGRAPRRWFPPLCFTVMPPVELAVDPALLGRARRRAVGTVLQGVMEQSAFATARTDRSLFTALLDAAHRHGPGFAIAEDIARAPMTYRRLVLGAAVLGRRLAAEVTPGGHGRRDAAERQRHPGHLHGAAGVRPGARHAELLRRAGRHAVRLRGGRRAGGAVLPRVRRPRQARPRGGADGGGGAVRVARGRARRARPAGQAARDAGRPPRPPPAGGTRRRRQPGRRAVHQRVRGDAEGRGAAAPQHPGQHRAGGRRGRLQQRRPRVQRHADVPLLRPDRGHAAAAAVGGADLLLPVAAALPHRAGADLRHRQHHRLRHRHLPDRVGPLRPPIRLLRHALHLRRRREAARRHPPAVCRAVRRAGAGRLRRHRDGARAGAELPHAQPARCRGPAAARHGAPAGTGARASRTAAACTCAGPT